MRRIVLCTLLAVGALGAGPGASAKSGGTSCKELQDRRIVLIKESELATANVEAKNVQLGEAATALQKAGDPARKEELQRRVDGLRRELNTLLDREHSTTDALGALDAEIGKKCLKQGGRK